MAHFEKKRHCAELWRTVSYISLLFPVVSRSKQRILKRPVEMKCTAESNHFSWCTLDSYFLGPHPRDQVAGRGFCEWASQNENVKEGLQLDNGRPKWQSESGIGPNLILSCWWIEKMLQGHWSLFLWPEAEWAFALILNPSKFYIKEEKWTKRNKTYPEVTPWVRVKICFPKQYVFLAWETHEEYIWMGTWERLLRAKNMAVILELWELMKQAGNT